MDIINGGKITLKLLIDKNSQKVLFAEVGKGVVDFLFSLLSLPIGSLTELITEESTFGPLRNTLRSWEQLSSNFLSITGLTANRVIPVISPTSASNFALLLRYASPAIATEKLYRCKCKCNSSFTYNSLTFCQSCHSYMNMELFNVGPGVSKVEVERNGYVKNGFSYALMDDLSMVPITLPLESIALLNKIGHKDLSLLEEKTVSLDIQQGLGLLKTSLWSKNVLTDFYLAKKEEGLEKEVK